MAKIVVSIKEIVNGLLKFDDEHIFGLHIGIAILLGLLTIFLIWRKVRGGVKRRAVLMMGLCESGKTQMYSVLCHGWSPVTVTTIKESSAPYVNGKKQVTIYDLPGHDRLRYSVFDKVKPQARAIMFILDSSTINKDIRDVAEFLYTVLCDKTIQTGLSNLLIVCNKQDLPLAKASSLIKATLEKEMNLLRITRSNQLQSVGDTSNNINFLGKPGVNFEFSQLEYTKVEFVESTSKDAVQMDNVKYWLTQLM